MPTFPSKQLLRQLQEQTEFLLETAIAQWQLIPHTKFARRPAPESWSANECIQHLNSYHRYYLAAIEKAMENTATQSKPVFKPGWLGNYFTNLMMVSDTRPLKKMKSPKDHAPVQIAESHLVISEFIDHQEKLLDLLHRAGEKDLNRLRVPISISKSIRLKLGDTFRFLIAHELRHFAQAQRALGADLSLPNFLQKQASL